MEELLTWETLLFSMGIFVFSSMIRRLSEKLLPSIRPDTPITVGQKVWEEFILPTMPVIVGVVLAMCMTRYPYPQSLMGSLGSRAIFGAVMGFACGYAFRIFKAVLEKKYNVTLPDNPFSNSVRPPNGP